MGLAVARLTDLTAKSAKPGRHTDGDGLMLVVSESGAKKWVLRYQAAGVRRDKGLGSYPEVGLKEARAKAAEDRRLLAAGQDPIAARRATEKAERPIPTFSEIAALVIVGAHEKSINEKVRYQWTRHLGEPYSGPLLNRPVNEITTVEVAALLRPVWRVKPQVAKKLYPAIRSVFERARVVLRDEHGVDMPRNPANWADLKAMGFETPKELSRGHHPSLPYPAMPGFIAELRTRHAVTARALEFLILTNVRTNAILQARWQEIDLERAVWTIPLASLKDREHRTEPFRVPLAPRAVEILEDLRRARVSEYVFPGQRPSAPFSNMAFLTLLGRMSAGGRKWLDEDGRPITAHGFRATFRTWAEEVATFPHAVIEQAMGHKVGSKVERAYRRTDVMEMRRSLMNAWAQHCSPPSVGNVVALWQST